MGNEQGGEASNGQWAIGNDQGGNGGMGKVVIGNEQGGNRQESKSPIKWKTWSIYFSY